MEEQNDLGNTNREVDISLHRVTYPDFQTQAVLKQSPKFLKNIRTRIITQFLI